MTAAVCAQTLPAGALLRGWRVESISSVVGDAILYAARHEETGDEAFLQEYFPPGVALRHPDGSVSARTGAAGEQFLAGRETFLMQGAALAGLCAARPLPNLPRVRSVFMHEGTAYMVMDRYGGASLQTELSLGHSVPEDRLIALFRPLALALGQLHDAGVCHLHISPAVIMRQNRRLLLTGFAGGGAPRGWEEDNSAAYSAIELLVPVATAGPWSDVYALGAVLYHCMTGTPPPEAVTRLGPVAFPEAAVENYTPAFRDAVAAALACVPADRPQSMRDWCAAWPKVGSEPEPASDAARGGAQAADVAAAPVQLPARGDEPGGELAPAVAPRPDGAGAAASRAFHRKLPLVAGAAAVAGVVLAFVLARGLFPAGDNAAGSTVLSQGFFQPSSAAEQSAPVLLLEQEVASAREAARHVAAQVQEAEKLEWPEEQVQALRQVADRAATAVAELEALHAAPDPSRRTAANRSFAAVLEQQRGRVKAALQEAWRIGAAGYAAAAEQARTNGDANYHVLEKLLADDKRPEPALLLGTAATAHGLLGTAYDRLREASGAAAPADPIAASRQMAEIAAAYEDVRSQSAALRDALRVGREHAAARQEELRVVTRERRQFRSALTSARRAAAELQQVMRAADGPDGDALPRDVRRDAALRVTEAKRRLARLEQIVLDTPDIRGERLQAALVEVRETEKGLRSMLLEVRGRASVASLVERDPEVERLVRRADSRLARNNRRYGELQKALAQHGGMIRIKDGDPVNQRDIGALYRSLMAQAALREKLAKAKTAAEAEAVYDDFASQHAKVDRDLDRMLRAASKADRL